MSAPENAIVLAFIIEFVTTKKWHNEEAQCSSICTHTSLGIIFGC